MCEGVVIMKTVLVGLILICAASSVNAQSSNPTVEAELRRLDIAAAKAIQEKDEKGIARYFTKNSVTNNPRNGLTRGTDGIIDAVRTPVGRYGGVLSKCLFT